MNKTNKYFINPSDSIESVYDKRLPESLDKLSPEDLTDNPTISTDSVNLMFEQFNILLNQFPQIDPPTLIPSQTFMLNGQAELDNLVKKPMVNAATDTSSDVKNGPCYYLVPASQDR